MLCRKMRLGPEACLLILVTRIDMNFESSTTRINYKSNFRNPTASYWGIVPLRTTSPFFIPEGSPLESVDFDGAFPNTGIHQVPLLEGVPPRVIYESVDPAGTLKDLLMQSFKKSEPSSNCCSCCFPWRVVAPLDDDEYVDDTTVRLSSTGASAIIRISEPRLHRIRPPHFATNATTNLQTDFMQDLFSSQPGIQAKMKKFTYDSMKFSSQPNITSYLPISSPELISDVKFKINSMAKELMQAFVDDLPTPRTGLRK